MYKKNISVREDYNFINKLIPYKKSLSRLHNLPLFFLPNNSILQKDITANTAKLSMYNSIAPEIYAFGHIIYDKLTTDKPKIIHPSLLSFCINLEIAFRRHCIDLGDILIPMPNTNAMTEFLDKYQPGLLLQSQITKTLSEEYITELLQHSATVDVENNDTYKKKYNKYIKEATENYSGKSFIAQLFFILEEFPENHFCYMPEHNGVKGVYYYYEIKKTDDIITVEEFNINHLKLKVRPVITYNKNTDSMYLSLHHQGIETKIPYIDIAESKDKVMTKHYIHMFNHFLRLISSIETYHNNDMYLIKKEVHNKNKLHNKKHKAKGSGKKQKPTTTLIFLNAIPDDAETIRKNATVKTGHKGGTHASPRPYKKRGFYRTLRHPKYKHHPKFGVEKGVYVRPTFVGCTHKLIDNVEYTLL